MWHLYDIIFSFQLYFFSFFLRVIFFKGDGARWWGHGGKKVWNERKRWWSRCWLGRKSWGEMTRDEWRKKNRAKKMDGAMEGRNFFFYWNLKIRKREIWDERFGEQDKDLEKWDIRNFDIWEEENEVAQNILSHVSAGWAIRAKNTLYKYWRSTSDFWWEKNI